LILLNKIGFVLQKPSHALGDWWNILQRFYYLYALFTNLEKHILNVVDLSRLQIREGHAATAGGDLHPRAAPGLLATQSGHPRDAAAEPAGSET
jgi:hypothetical protein